MSSTIQKTSKDIDSSNNQYIALISATTYAHTKSIDSSYFIFFDINYNRNFKYLKFYMKFYYGNFIMDILLWKFYKKFY